MPVVPPLFWYVCCLSSQRTLYANPQVLIFFSPLSPFPPLHSLFLFCALRSVFVYNLSTLSRVISAQWVRSLTHICESSQYTPICSLPLPFLLSPSLSVCLQTFLSALFVSRLCHKHNSSLQFYFCCCSSPSNLYIYIYAQMYIYSVHIFLSDLLSAPAMPRQMYCVCVVAVSLCRSVQFLRKFQSFLMSLTTRSACKGVASAALLD